MRKAGKITLWVLGSLLVVIIGLFLCADIIASKVVQKKVAKACIEMPGVKANVGGVYLNLISGSAIVKDITFSTNSLTLEDSVTGNRAPGLAVHIPRVSVWNISYAALLRERSVRVFHISVDDPKILVYLDEENPEAIMPFMPKDTVLEKAGMWLQSVEVRSFDLNRLSARLRSTRTPLFVSVDSLSVSTPKMVYDLVDSLFTYNDSVYDVQLKAMHVETPDGLWGIEAHDLHLQDQGPLNLGYTHIKNLFTHTQMADMQRQPITWLDIELNSVHTSPFNPIRKALAQDCHLDSLNADVKYMHVFTDQCYPPKTPYGTPHDFLRHVPVEFGVKQVKAHVHKMFVELATTPTNIGQLHLKNMRAHMTNVTNHAGATWTSHATGPFGENGKMDASFIMHMDKNATFEVKMDVKEVNTDVLNSFVRPLVGITSQCHINRLDAQYKGDRNIAKGEFCMQYHGLEVLVHKTDKIPYEIVTKYANTFTELANTLVPKSNPTAVDIAPRKYAVEWKRDEWKPYPLFVFGPCIDGIKMTMLPGLYVHKQIK